MIPAEVIELPKAYESIESDVSFLAVYIGYRGRV